MIKGNLDNETISIFNISAQNVKASRFLKDKLHELQEEKDNKMLLFLLHLLFFSETKFIKKIICIFFRVIIKVIFLLVFFFFFGCSLDILGSSFQLLGGKLTGLLFFDGSILYNPVAALMVSVLVTVLMQSSSISASIIVSMVSSSVLTVQAAIPMIMGSNIGTTITSTLVALVYAGDRDEFGRVFAGAAIHAFFNWLSVLVLLPVELITGFLNRISYKLTTSIKIESEDDALAVLKGFIRSITAFIIQLDKKVFTEIASGYEGAKNKRLTKIWCKTFENVTFSNVSVSSPENCTSLSLCWTEGNMTWTLIRITYKQNITKCKHLFVNTSLSDSVIGFILLPLSLLVLCTCLMMFVRILNSELKGPVAAVLKKYINSDFPFPFTWLAGYIAILVGALMTFLVQSSSVFTTIMTPLIGIGVITLERAYTLILGSNIGTTTTAILAALASPGKTFRKSLQIALCHFFFNLTGILLWYPVPFIRLPLLFARHLGIITATYRWFAIVYLIVCFFLGPLLVFCFSIASRRVLIIVGLPLFFLPFVLVYLQAFNVLHPLPLWMTSLKPWDDLITCIMNQCRQCGENLSHQCKNSKLNRFATPTIRPDPGPDQNQKPGAMGDSLFHAKKSDNTMTEKIINKGAVLNDASAY
ncbi:sodium-dependent phosphate transport protein 2B-like [Gracilinanus agilis]|uniref:sodium-dependent phosphate transport protein 2B-like n=1 Tax=Gracilinanus agilis TaxID=191870 RepID=UPI001CFE53DF|nr:sodium-dependent phosphate transport protein 2B-like [Gracilinanus agilis]